MLPEWRFCPQCNLDLWEAPVMPMAVASPVAPACGQTPYRADLTRPQPPGGKITVQVFDAETGESVRNAKVSCKGPTAQAAFLTDIQGRIEAPDAEPGIYKLLVQASGYRDGQTMEELKEGKPLNVVIRVEPLPGKVSGNVYDAATKLPLSGARIRSDSSRVKIDTATDSLGRFEAAAPAGPCILTCAFSGYVTGREGCVVPPGGEALVDFGMTAEPGKGIPVAAGPLDETQEGKDLGAPL